MRNVFVACGVTVTTADDGTTRYGWTLPEGIPAVDVTALDAALYPPAPDVVVLVATVTDEQLAALLADPSVGVWE